MSYFPLITQPWSALTISYLLKVHIKYHVDENLNIIFQTKYFIELIFWLSVYSLCVKHMWLLTTILMLSANHRMFIIWLRSDEVEYGMKGIYMWSIWLFNNFGMKYLSPLSYMFILIVHYPLLLWENNVALSRLMEIPVRKCQLTIALKVTETEEGIRPSRPASPCAVPFTSH